VRFDILTIFPEMFPPVLAASILGRAADAKLADYHVHDIRPFADNKHAKVDDRPFGGGPGMVMMCQPLYDCVTAVEKLADNPADHRILLSPQGAKLDQATVEYLATAKRLMLIAGHYEGVDERVIDELEPLQISLGDYVLSGGELPAMVLIDTIVRLLPGVLGHADSAAEDSFAPREIHGARQEGSESAADVKRLLDCPHYTRPQVWKGRAVPNVLLSGDHEAVAQWRMQQMMERTRERRPDLLDN